MIWECSKKLTGREIYIKMANEEEADTRLVALFLIVID